MIAALHSSVNGEGVSEWIDIYYICSSSLASNLRTNCRLEVLYFSGISDAFWPKVLLDACKIRLTLQEWDLETTGWGRSSSKDLVDKCESANLYETWFLEVVGSGY